MKRKGNKIWVHSAGWRVWPLILSFLLIPLLGCEREVQGPNASSAIVSLYYLVDLEKTPSSQRAVVQEVPSGLSPMDATVGQLLDLLRSPPEETLLSPLPEGTMVLSCEQEGKRLFLDLSEAYGTLTGYDLTRANCAIAMTLTQLSEIDDVVLTVEGKPLPGWEQTVLGKNVAVTSEREPEIAPIEVALYFWSPEDSALKAEYRTISTEQDTVLAARIVQALIEGPEQEGLEALLPRDTTLLEISIENRCCTLTLSNAFWTEVPESVSRQEAVLYSVVRSLSNLEFIDSVQFQTANGSASYGSFSLEKPLS